MIRGASELPEGWAWCTLADICEIRQGQSPPSASYRPMEAGEGIPFLQGNAEFTNATPIPRKRTTEPKVVAPTGSVLLSVRAPVGDTNFAPNGEVAIGRGLAALTPLGGISSGFIFWLLRGSRPWLEARATGTTFDAVTGRVIKSLPVALPPLNEQTRIVRRLEGVIATMDVGVAEAAASEALTRVLLAAVLNAAVRGDLVPSSGKTAEPLLREILDRRRAAWEVEQAQLFDRRGRRPRDDSWKSRYPEPVAPSNDEVGPELPVGWVWATVDQVSNRVEYGSSSKTSPSGDGVAVLRMGNIDQGEIARLDDLKYLPADHVEFPKLLLEDGDLLFNRTNSAELVGKTAVYRSQVEPCSFASYLIRVRLIDGVIPEYVSMVINSGFGRAWIGTVASQQVGQANVNGTKLRSLAFPLPPLEEQKQIVVAARGWRAQAVAALGDASAVRESAATLERAVLNAALSGSLTTQDPGDESADVLLEVIRAIRSEGAQSAGKSTNRHASRVGAYS